MIVSQTNLEVRLGVLQVAANSDGAVVKISSLERGQQVQLQARVFSGPFVTKTGDSEIIPQLRTHIVRGFQVLKSYCPRTCFEINQLSSIMLQNDQCFDVAFLHPWRLEDARRNATPATAHTLRRQKHTCKRHNKHRRPVHVSGLGGTYT
jgi:hypothetical protein